MTYLEFKQKYLLKSTDYDKAYWYQCVDLIKTYLSEVFNIKSGALWNAYNIFVNTPKELTKFKKTVNTPTLVPKAWDIVIFNKSKSNWFYWHIAIVDEGTTVKDLYVIEQNAWSWNWDWKLNNRIYRRKKNRKDVAWFYLV